jgi:hypothetical protein
MRRWLYQIFKWGLVVVGLYAAFIALNAAMLVPGLSGKVRIGTTVVAAVVSLGAFNWFSRLK